MKELTDLQNQFQAYLLNSDQQINSCIVSTEKVPTDVRLNIYGYAYRSRLLEALADSYPILHTYMGDEQFDELGSCYVDAYPSSYRSIRWFGDQLASFLKTHAHYSQWPYLAELAELEWTMTLSFDAADSQWVDLNIVSTIPPESWADMRLSVHPSAHLLNLSWNVTQLWQEMSDQKTPSQPIKSESPLSWIFWRKEWVTQFCSLPQDEAYALKAVLQGLTFGEICEGLCQWVDEQEAAMRAASLLKGWISSGLITGITV